MAKFPFFCRVPDSLRIGFGLVVQTGDSDKGTGSGRWVGSPSIGWVVTLGKGPTDFRLFLGEACKYVLSPQSLILPLVGRLTVPVLLWLPLATVAAAEMPVMGNAVQQSDSVKAVDDDTPEVDTEATVDSTADDGLQLTGDLRRSGLRRNGQIETTHEPVAVISFVVLMFSEVMGSTDFGQFM